MTEEFKYQVFKTAAQWSSGLLYRLEMLKDGRITLYSTPVFSQWVQAVKGIGNIGAISVDECGQVYFIENDFCRLYRYNPMTQNLELVPYPGGCGLDPGKFKNPKRTIIDRYTMWVLDTGNNRLQAFSRETFQVKYIIDNLDEIVDFGVDSDGFLYVLSVSDQGAAEIFKYTNSGAFVKSFGGSVLQDPVGLAIGKNNIIYVIDSESPGFHTFTHKGQYQGLIGDFSSIPGTLQNPTVTIDKKGGIYVSDSGTGMVQQFDPDGSYIGNFSIPGLTGAIPGIGVDPRGNLYIGTSQGIVFFSKQQTYSKEKGIYYTKTLDSGTEGCQWHRMKLDLDLPPRTMVEVYYYAADDEDLKDYVENCLAANDKSTQQKAECIDGHKGGLIPWKEPEKNPEDMLFQEGIGRYLWIKLELSTFEETVRPSVTGMRIFYPRQSYLRYLPAIYQEDPASKEFLERFLSLFESQFYDLETEIAHIFKYLDPGTTPAGFLRWLGSWLNLALEEEWEEDKKRILIKEAAALYKQKGTPGGLTRLIEIYTGIVPMIREHMKAVRPMVLNKKLRLGMDTILIQTPIRGFRLGDDSILGRAALRDEAMLPEDPFLPLAHRFTVLLDLTPQEYNRLEKGIIRILEEEKPAHTKYKLRNTAEFRVGMNTYVGINAKLSDYRPIRLTTDSILGTGLIVFDNGEPGGKVERRSKIERDLKLI